MRLHPLSALLAGLLAASTLAAETEATATVERTSARLPVFVGTTEPMAAHAVYFLMTDRFVNGDPSNDHREQGLPDHGTWGGPVPGAPPGKEDFVGYLGGDFRGILDNAGYIRDLGFGAVWLTPIVEQPDEAFSGGTPAAWGKMFTDGGKSGYHGYWGTNFYQIDEHLPSEGLDFRALAAGLRARGLKTVLDVVANHGSPSFSAPEQRDQFGKLFNEAGELVADHKNLHPKRLKPERNPLHAFFHPEPDIAQLSNFDESNRAVVDYLVGSSLKWLGQGADALRLDTIKHMPLPFWKTYADRLRAEHPGLFMFGEAFDYDPELLGRFTQPGNGSISVLDFPLQKAMGEVFGKRDAGYEAIVPALFLDDGPYANPYVLMTFYDNHDMPRLDADDAGFINANNLLFTVRGIPVVYQGSEVGFMRGTAEHAGNRNYFGQARIDAAPSNLIHAALKRIANLRANTPALQRGLQVNLEFQGDRAAFYRILEQDGVAQTALVLLNKGDTATRFRLTENLQPGRWRPALGGETVPLAAGRAFEAEVPANGVQVYLFEQPITAPALRAAAEAAARAIPASRGAVPAAD
ncbi:MAG: alpha-amylase family glycosyl hydrolase [Lysobacteraceae bacterium]